MGKREDFRKRRTFLFGWVAGKASGEFTVREAAEAVYKEFGDCWIGRYDTIKDYIEDLMCDGLIAYVGAGFYRVLPPRPPCVLFR